MQSRFGVLIFYFWKIFETQKIIMLQKIKLRHLLSKNEILISDKKNIDLEVMKKFFYSEIKMKKKLDLGTIFFTKLENGKIDVKNPEKLVMSIIIFISALFEIINKRSFISISESKIYEDMVKFDTVYRIRLLGNEQNFFKNYVVDRVVTKRVFAKTKFEESIADCYDFFISKLEEKSADEIKKMLESIENAVCSFCLIELN